MIQPIHTSKRVQLRDGLTVFIRPITSADKPHLIDVFNNLSSESRVQRFLRVLDNASPELIDSTATAMTQAIVNQGQGWLAFAHLPEQSFTPLGGVQYARIDAHTGELAITIRDDMQGRGLGTVLINHLVEQAIQRGLHTINGLAYHNNYGLWKLLAQTQLPLTRRNDGPEVFFELNLT